jgi:hypothetical protein
MANNVSSEMCVITLGFRQMQQQPRGGRATSAFNFQSTGGK